MASSGLLRWVALVRTDVSEELSASIIRVNKIGELGTMLAVTSNRRTLRKKNSSILVTLMMEALSSSETSFLQEPHGVTSQKTLFFVGSWFDAVVRKYSYYVTV
jgi:demethoxyubiquinone hydroxylase (CLK1/Coq7/Cat5 family)